MAHRIALVALAIVLFGPAAQAEIVRITAVNGDYDAAHAEHVDVRPGDLVQLAADLFRDNGDGTWSALDRPAEDFLWVADDSPTDHCTPAEGAACLGDSNFEANDYGVAFYVPYDFTGETITVRVVTTKAQALGDQLVLDVDTSATPSAAPTTLVTDPATYAYASLAPQVALAGHGRWVVIDGVRYFIPYTYAPNWVPYRNGYWSWTGDEDGAGDGWTWISYDAWGWMTDHYGAWRHHGVYGWIWLPFAGDQFRYHRHWVTWFDDGREHVGWYPYRDGWRDGYRHGREQGFDDGYWSGYAAGRHYGEDGYVGGFTVVHGRDLGDSNCRDRRLGDEAGITAWRTGYAHHYYGAYPGAGRVKNARASRGWVERGYHTTVPGTRTERRVVGDRELRYPVRVRPMPDADAHPAYEAQDTLHRPAPIGAAFRPTPTPLSGRDAYTPPTADGRGLAHPPQTFDPATRTFAPLPPRTTRPVAPNPRNPIYRRAPTPTTPDPTPTPIPRPTPTPRYRPGQPTFPAHPTGRPVVTPTTRLPPTRPPIVHPPSKPPVKPPPARTPPCRQFDKAGRCIRR